MVIRPAEAPEMLEYVSVDALECAAVGPVGTTVAATTKFEFVLTHLLLI